MPTCPLGVSQATINADQKLIKKRSETDRPTNAPHEPGAENDVRQQWAVDGAPADWAIPEYWHFVHFDKLAFGDQDWIAP